LTRTLFVSRTLFVNEHCSQGVVVNPPQPTRPPGHQHRWLILAVVLVVEIMDLLDAVFVAIAAPSVQSDIGGGNTLIQWIAAGYTLAYAVGLITGGRLGDLYGRRRMFLLGLVGFMVMSLLCGLATSPELLVGLRVLQGLFGAVLIPQGFGLIKSVFGDDEIGAAFGAFGPAIGLSAVGGPILAGALIAWDPAGLGWRAIFLINVPIGLICLVLARRVLPESRAADGPRPDPVGALLITTGLTLLVFPLIQGRELGWPAWTIVLMAASIPVIALFGRHQLRRRAAGRSPLVEPALFRSRAFVGGLVVAVVFFGAMIALVFALGLYLQLGLGFGALQAGLAQAPWALGMVAGAVLGGTLLSRHGRPVLQAGAAVMALGLGGVLLTVLANGGAVDGWSLAPGLVVCGIGTGLVTTPLFDIVLAGVQLPMVGSASGVLNAVQQLGGTAGVAALGTVFFGLIEAGDPVGAFTTVLWLAIALALLTGVLTVLLPRRARAAAVPA
jgi:EmrB/QacA subfamily drug resistance transporter